MLNLPKKILVVEDDETMRLTLSALLQREGFEVLVAEDGEAGLLLALTNCPDLIITDLNMPLMDGVELAKSIRRESGRISQAPILALSANINEYNLPERINSGINRFFDKALNDRSSLLNAVYALMESEQADEVVQAA